MIRFDIPAMAWVSKKSGKQRWVIDAKYQEGKVPNWSRKTRYQDWKRHVQEYAALAGVKLPLRPTKNAPVYVVTLAYFQSGVHPDPSNVWEGITDALCYVSPEEQRLGAKRGSDKYMGGLFYSPNYDKRNPRVGVTVATEEEFSGVVVLVDRLLAEEAEDESWM